MNTASPRWRAVNPGKWFATHGALPLLDLRRGTNSRAFYQIALRNVRRPIEELRREQWARLRLLLDHAFRSVPYYHAVFRAAGIRPDDVRTPEDFQKIRPLEKETILHRPGQLHARDLPQRKPQVAKTGGSTGQPLQYYVDRDSLGWAFALQWRGWGYAGFTPGDRRATLAGLSVVAGGSAFRRWLRNRVFERNLALPAIRLNPALIEEYLRRLRAWRPSFLIGYPSALVTFCRVAGHEARELGLRAAFTTAEMLYPEERRYLKDALGCPVLDGYGANDGGVSAYECGEHPGYHVDVERALLEVVADGEPAAPGEAGEVLATDLYNFSMPFIRYAVGDVAVPGGESASCGRTLSLLERIEGRTTDFLVLQNGVVLSGPALTLVFKDFSIDDYFVEQVSDTRVRVQIVTRPGGTTPESVADALRRHLGPDVDLEVNAVPAIPRPPGAKRRFIVSNVPLALR